jgi:putative membrane protein
MEIMHIAAKIIIALVALIHLYIMWLEMFGWMTKARKVFRKFPPELFAATKPMAANQGLYNGFLATGLVWSLLINDQQWSINVATFFLGCVFVAGCYGAATVQKSILYVQAIPAMLGLILIYLFK